MTVSRLDSAGRIGHRMETTASQSFLLILLIVAIVLSPNFTISEGIYRPRGEDFILIALVVLWIPAVLSRRYDVTARPNKTSASLPISFLLAAMFYMAVISIGVGTIAFQQELILNDWMILPMIARYWLIFRVAQWLGQPTKRHVYLWVLVISLGISAGVGVLQQFNLFEINNWLTPLYVMPHMEIVGLEMVKLGLPDARVVGTHGDPRHYAYILVVGIALCLAILLNRPGRRMQLAAAVVLGLCLMGIAFSDSRTAALVLIVVFFVTVVTQGRGLEGATKIVIPLLAVGILLALVSSASETSILQERVFDWESRSFDQSLQARIRDLLKPLQDGLENPVILIAGRGPSKAALRTDSHNDFGWYFLRFGLPGLVLYLSLLMYSLRLTLRAWSEVASPIERVVTMLAFLSTANWFLFAMAENVFKDPQLMGLNMLVLGAFSGTTRSQPRS